MNCETDCLFADLEFDDEDYSTPAKKQKLDAEPNEAETTENDGE